MSLGTALTLIKFAKSPVSEPGMSSGLPVTSASIWQTSSGSFVFIPASIRFSILHKLNTKFFSIPASAGNPNTWTTLWFVDWTKNSEITVKKSHWKIYCHLLFATPLPSCLSSLSPTLSLLLFHFPFSFCSLSLLHAVSSINIHYIWLHLCL